MKCGIRYFKTRRGDQPVQIYLNKLSEKDSARIFVLLHELASTGSLTQPHGKKLVGQKNLYELRYRRHRILYCYHEQDVILLHAFMKKAQETPQKELALALERKNKF